MPWTAGVTRAVGDIITASDWNSFNGSGGNFDFITDGTSILNELVYEASLKMPNAAADNKLVAAIAVESGGLRWKSAFEIPEIVSLM